MTHDFSVATTFQDALQQQLTALDAAYTTIRKIHVDIEHSNNLSREYKIAMEEYQAVERAIWRLKAAWADYTK